jgi:hypothetical protein
VKLHNASVSGILNFDVANPDYNKNQAVTSHNPDGSSELYCAIWIRATARRKTWEGCLSFNWFF